MVFNFKASIFFVFNKLYGDVVEKESNISLIKYEFIDFEYLVSHFRLFQ